MAVEHNATTSEYGEGSSVSFAHVPAGSNRVLLVGIVSEDQPADLVAPSAVTFGGQALTQVGSTLAFGGSLLSVWRLIAPASGSASVQVTWPEIVSYAVGASSFTGAHQSAPIGASASATGTGVTASATVAGTIEGGLVVDVVGVAAGSATTTVSSHGGQVETWNALGGPVGFRDRGAGSYDDAGGSAAFAWTLSASKAWALFAVELLAAPSGAPGIRRGPAIGKKLIKGGG